MSCLDVRELLPELAVGALPPGEREDVERHLRWCAGCRKETAELDQAAAALGFALAPAAVTPGLDDRVVLAVRRAAGTTTKPRRIRTAAASLVAATVAFASLGWGAVMAGRADRFAERAEQAERSQALALERFQRVIAGIVPGRELPDGQTHLGRLTPTPDGQGGAAALQLVSPELLDFSIVIVNGLDPEASERLPYRIELLNEGGEVLRAGRIDELDPDGGADAFHEFAHADLTGYSIVRVVDARGTVVLAGEVAQG